MNKPTYYLWKKDFSSEEEFNQVKQKYANAGFRTVTFLDGNSKQAIHEAIHAVIQNHLDES